MTLISLFKIALIDRFFDTGAPVSEIGDTGTPAETFLEEIVMRL